MVDHAARDKLIEENLGYARALAAQLQKELSGGTLGIEDLVAYGTQGLVEAADRYDPTRGVAFSTFAYYRIRGAIFDGLRSTGWLGRRRHGRFASAANDYLENLGQRTVPPGPGAASKADEAAELGQALSDLAIVFLTSMSTATGDDPPDTERPDQSLLLEAAQVQTTVLQAIGTLPDKERRLVELYYYQGLTLEDAGRELGLSKSWSSRLHARAIRLLARELHHLSP
jgi:RNA polymerase sigma factor for flagellar operon FliA